MTYTLVASLVVVASVALDLVVLRTRVLGSKAFWTAYAIILTFQLITNGVLTGQGVVLYDGNAIEGWRIAYAPVEDLLFGFALVVQTLSWWDFWGRRDASRADRRAAPEQPTQGAGH